jgi:hypothetical protein
MYGDGGQAGPAFVQLILLSRMGYAEIAKKRRKIYWFLPNKTGKMMP